MIQFKTERIRQEWESGSLPSLLVEVVVYYAKVRDAVLDEDTVLTSIWRSKEENRGLGSRSSTHVEWRAVDARVNVEEYELEDLCRQIVNKAYPTHIDRMPRIAPLRHGTGPHAHVQVTRLEAAT